MSEEIPADENEALRSVALEQIHREEREMSLSQDEIQNRVNYHAPSPSGVERHKALSDAAAVFLKAISDVVPPGREQSLAITNVEQAKMWASAGVARNPSTV